jgi:hypothetical protein
VDYYKAIKKETRPENSKKHKKSQSEAEDVEAARKEKEEEDEEAHIGGENRNLNLCFLSKKFFQKYVTLRFAFYDSRRLFSGFVHSTRPDRKFVSLAVDSALYDDEQQDLAGCQHKRRGGRFL